MSRKTAVYAGTFDPPTYGHAWMIGKGYVLFYELIVAIGINPDKRCMFTLEERLEMLRQYETGHPNMRFETFENKYLVRFARDARATHILRGIRSVADFEYERTLRYLNEDFDPGITTVFLMPPREIADISSSIVKGLVGPDDWEQVVKQFVSPFVFDKLKERHHASTR
ncbi:MAG TPA: pantetheine-phosphate adenylyltransferase [Candidatus Paceibacterota bacterium]|nr:pantetheine-phosphate adenylyltransferase [Candidatus Paceibacterota bacterium]